MHVFFSHRFLANLLNCGDVSEPSDILIIRLTSIQQCVAVNFFLQLIFILPLFLGMVMYDYEFKTKEE